MDTFSSPARSSQFPRDATTPRHPLCVVAVAEARDPTQPDESIDPADAVRANNELWDEWTRIQEAWRPTTSRASRPGSIQCRQLQRARCGMTGLEPAPPAGPLRIDTLSWARLRAKVTVPTSARPP